MLRAPAYLGKQTASYLIEEKHHKTRFLDITVHFPVIMQGRGTFISPFPRPRCLAAAAPAGKAKLTHPGKAILAGKLINCQAEKSVLDKMSLVRMLGDYNFIVIIIVEYCHL